MWSCGRVGVGVAVVLLPLVCTVVVWPLCLSCGSVGIAVCGTGSVPLLPAVAVAVVLSSATVRCGIVAAYGCRCGSVAAVPVVPVWWPCWCVYW